MSNVLRVFLNFKKGLVFNKYYLQEHTRYQFIRTGIVLTVFKQIIIMHLKLAIAFK